MHTSNNVEFINKANKKHDNYYDYSKVEYINNFTKVIIICKLHGEFEQRPNSHLNGNGCMKCSGRSKLNTQEFIKRARILHGDKYDYSKVIYVNTKTNVIIICREHGEFTQRPFNHLNGKGHGCIKCGGKLKSNTQNFINKSIKIHGDKYDYSNVAYTHSSIHVTIICKIHGEFKQRPYNHLHSKGCIKCNPKPAQYKKLNTREFIQKAISIHGNTDTSTGIISCKYDYSKVIYVNSKIHVTIICKEHGEFTQLPYNHLRNIGCSKCRT